MLKIKTLFLILLISLIFYFDLYSQSFKVEAGKSVAMSDASVTLSDIWSVYHNQAGLGNLEDISIGAFHQSGFIKEQNVQGIAFALPTRTGTIGVSYAYYGFSQYNEMQAGLAFGRSFTKYFSVGIQLNYIYTHIADNYGTEDAVNFEIGILSEPIDNLVVGAHIYNPLRSKLGKKKFQPILIWGFLTFFRIKYYLQLALKKIWIMMPFLKQE